ncbi:MAG: glutamate dehydrogenase, partial [Pseudomonadota bacterium]
MSAKKSSSAAQSSALHKALKSSLSASILPGETPLEKSALESAARFLLEAAQKRAPSRSVITQESDTSERRLRIAIINDDMPFLVDSIAATITANGLSIDQLLHPIAQVTRDKSGVLTAIGGKDQNAKKESLIYIETPRVDARQRRSLLSDLRKTLEDVRAAVNDWPQMRDAMANDAERLGDNESAKLLDWLNRDMLTQLGSLIRTREGEVTDSLGICRKSAKSILADTSYELAFEWFEEGGPERHLLAVKANQVSNVHRRVPLDVFLVPIREGSKVTALCVHAGVWTSAALTTPPASVPAVRKTLAGMTDRLGIDLKGHAGKALTHAFSALPSDLLVTFQEEDTARLATAMMSLVDRPRPRVILVKSPLGR